MKKLQTILVLGLCVTALPSIVNAAQGEYYLRADLGYLKGKIINTKAKHELITMKINIDR